MADVVTKSIDANDIENGNAVSTVNKVGTIQALERHDYTHNDLDQLNDVLGDRLDNPTYYSS